MSSRSRDVNLSNVRRGRIFIFSLPSSSSRPALFFVEFYCFFWAYSTQAIPLGTFDPFVNDTSRNYEREFIFAASLTAVLSDRHE